MRLVVKPLFSKLYQLADMQRNIKKLTNNPKKIMKLKLFLLMLLTATFPLLAQQATVKGTVVDAKTGKPVAGAAVMLNDQGLVVTTGPSGDFSISNVAAGSDVIISQWPYQPTQLSTLVF